MELNQHGRQRRALLTAAGGTWLASVIPDVAIAQTDASFPNGPITIVVPYAPGGGTDIVARMLGAELSKRLKTPVVVDNKPGAGGQIGNSFVARSAPNGQTLLVGITTLIQAPSLYRKLPYDVFKDFTPLAQLATSVNFLTVPASTPVNSYKEFVEYAKSRRGNLSYGSNGNAGTSHLHGGLFNTELNLDAVHVPYSGSGPLLTAMLSGTVDFAFVDIAPLRPHVQSGKLKVLAVTGPKRSPAFPDVPTLEEVGLTGFDPVGWFSLFGPANLPPAVSREISAATAEAMRVPELSKRVEELGLTPSQLSLAAFEKSMHDDMGKWQNMVKAGNISVE